MKNLPYNESWTDRIRWSWLGRFWYWKIENKFLYSFRCFFNPKHNKVRKSIPRVWRDSDYLIVRTNFAIITEFYEDEFLGGFIDWDYDESHKEFKNWLIESYNYILYFYFLKSGFQYIGLGLLILFGVIIYYHQ